VNDQQASVILGAANGRPTNIRSSPDSAEKRTPPEVAEGQRTFAAFARVEVPEWNLAYEGRISGICISEGRMSTYISIFEVRVPRDLE